MNLVVAAVGGAAALGLLALTIRRPIFGCAVLVLTVPLTAGLTRGAVIPVLKASEVILLVVLAGVVIHQVTTRRSRPVSGLDIAVGAYVIGSIVIPWTVLLLSHWSADLDTWRTVLSPALFLGVYYVFSRTAPTHDRLRIVLNSTLAAGVIVGLIAGAEILNLPGVRDFFATYYPGPSQASYRANSTLGHYSAVGAFGLLTFILALSLAAFRHRDFPGWWLAAVMGASALGMLASGTWAALATLPVATVIVLFYARRVPRELIVTVACAAVLVVVLWPEISQRIESQQLITAQGFALPESMQTRIRYWTEFIIPALSDHLWVGTGTVIPSTVPDRLTSFVVNEYLWAAFRAGLVGVALLVGMLLTIMSVAWKQRGDMDPSRRVIGAASLATCAMLLMLGATAQYITFAGLSQEIAMLVGVLAGLTAAVDVRRPAAVVVANPKESTALGLG